MIRKSGHRFSEKIMLKQRAAAARASEVRGIVGKRCKKENGR
jgi:hypothetical protein